MSARARLRAFARRVGGRSGRLAAVLALLGVATAVSVPVVLAREHGAPTERAVTLYVNPSGSDKASCTKASPCASFGRAYRVASPGATVLVGSGSYPEQTIGYDASKSGANCNGYSVPAVVSGCITFRPAVGASVTFTGEITIIGNGVRLVSFDLGSNGLGINPGGVCHLPVTTGVILDKLKSNGGKVAIDAAAYVADLHGNWANGNGESLIAHSCNAGTSDEPKWIEPTHIRLDHSWYHDVVQHTTDSSEHIECIHLDAADYVTIVGSRFTNCAGYNIRIAYEHRDVENVSHYLIENNVFAVTCSEQQVGFDCFPIAELEFDCSGLSGTSCDSNVVRFNSIDGHFHPSVEDGGSGFTNSAFYGNVVAAGDDEFHCKTYRGSGLVYHHNVFGPVAQQKNPSTPCGPTDVIADPGFVHPGPPDYDFHLRRGVKAIGRAPMQVAGGYPAVDGDGAMRPKRWAVDAGAHQWETALIVPGRSLGAVRLGETEADVVAFYGRPARRSVARIGRTRLATMSYRLHGGQLLLYLEGDRVVGVATSSPYYSTATGVGAGVEAAQASAWRGIRRLECRRELVRSSGDVEVVLALVGKKAEKVSTVTMIRKRYGFGACNAGR